MRAPSLALGFALGACTGAAASGLADVPPPTPVSDAPLATVVTRDAAPRRIAPSGKAAIRVYARGDAAFVGELSMDAGGAVPRHRDETEEYIYVLEGGGTITIDGTPTAIGPGTTVFMPANAEVSYQNGDAPFVALQVFAGPAPAAKYDGWTDAAP